MKNKIRRTVSILILVVILFVIGTIAAGAIAKSNLANKFPAPGQMVDIGGYKLHINCIGQGNPTVILEAGSGDYSLTWAYVQPEVAKTTRVCSYDRAGFGWSEPSPYPRTANAEVEELHTLLVNASIPGPYVLVGHSLGGMLVRMYAHKYPDEVAGMVLIDSLHEARHIRNPNLAKAIQEAAGQFRMVAFLSSTGLMALLPQSIPNPGFPVDVYAQFQAITATTGAIKTWVAELNAGKASCAEALALHMTDFGDMPLIVLSAGHGDSLPSFSVAENQQLWENMQTEQSELAVLSSNSKQILAEQSGHNIQLEQPVLVIDAIQQMVDAIRK